MESTYLYIASHLPDTLSGYAYQVVVGMLLAMITTSFVEHLIHKHVMHHGLPLFRKKRFFEQQFKSHAMLHHGIFYKEFDHEDDPIGREESITFTNEEIIAFQFIALPLFIMIALFSPVIALCFPITGLLHNILWNVFHREMHQPQKPKWTRTSLYRFLARYHFLHHRHTNTNYNVVFPFADFILNTRAVTTVADRDAIRELGY